MRTAQELYEECIKHLRKQGQKSSVPCVAHEKPDAYVCKYRDPEGNKCAVGALIPDIEYMSTMEGWDVNDLIEQDLLTIERSAEFYKYRRLLSSLQNIHDNKPIDQWEKHWRMLADDFGLKYLLP